MHCPHCNIMHHLKTCSIHWYTGCACSPACWTLQVPYRIYFGREIAGSDRSIIHKYGLPRRKYLGPTSMDREMAFLMCNQAQVSWHTLSVAASLADGSPAAHLAPAAPHKDLHIPESVSRSTDQSGSLFALSGCHSAKSLICPSCI